tara:strand:+ start:391 stop:1830 length:1440 start_codon:yes stop_codon:yes gene_type:complete
MSDLADIEQKFQFGTSAKFDFDIRNYDINDMMNILNISGDPSKLNFYSVKKKTNNVIQKLREDVNLSSDMKDKFESFLKALEFFLIYKYNVKVDNYVMDKKKIDPSKLLANVKVNDGRGGGGGGGSNEMVSINTYKRKIIKRQLSFDTKFRPNYFKSSPANFKMVLSTPLKNVIAMRLISLEFPNVVYDVDATLGTNEFSVIYHPDNDTDFGGVGNTTGGAIIRKTKYGIKAVGREIGGVGGQTGSGDGSNTGTATGVTTTLNSADGDTTAGWKVKYNLPSGNYQSNTITAALNNFIIDDKIVFSIDTKTGRTVISTDISGAGAFGDLDNDATFDLDFTNTVEPNIPMTKNLGWKLGFRQQKYAGSTTYISEAPIDLGGQKVLFFCVDDYRTNVCENVSIVYENSFMNRNIMARIPIRQGKFVVVYDDGSDNIRKSREYFGPVKIDKLHFTLMDEYGIEIRQGYSDFSFGLEFDILYEK